MKDLEKLGQWVTWQYEDRGGKQTKVPLDPNTGMRASSTDPDTWGTHEEAETARRQHGLPGVGFVFMTGVVGIDLDHCRDSETGFIEPWALKIIGKMKSYSEVSPSGTGIHILCFGSLPSGRRRSGRIEMYDSGRFFTVTRKHLAGTPAAVMERTAEIAVLHQRTFPAPDTPSRPVAVSSFEIGDDADLVARAMAARNGAKFAALWQGAWQGMYPSQSEADQGLANILAFWAAGDSARVDRLFRQSGLYRPKWDQLRGERTYGELTIARAVGGQAIRSSRGVAM